MAWYKIRRAAGVPDVRLHDLRHSYASLAAAQGLSLPFIGVLLGHRDAKTTTRYTHLTEPLVQQAATVVGNAMAAALRLRHDRA
jgi:integrase